MRIRLRSLPPLPPLKVWFEIPSTIAAEDNSIALLKREICQRLLSSAETIHATQIILELDEFELLDDSTVSVIRENDLLVVKYKPNSAIGKKRKRDSVTEERNSLVLRKVPQSTATPSSSSGSSTSSSSEDSSSSDTDDSSSTASSTTSSSSSDSSTSAGSTPVRIRPPDLRNTTKHSSSLTTPVYGQLTKGHNVPPGQGKTSTHQRNLRRRKKRLAEKEEAQNRAPDDTRPAQRHDLVRPVPITSVIDDMALQESMLRATKNDNKKKGFKQGMQTMTAKHQLFQEDSTQLSSPSKATPNTTQRLIPPSERTDLPKNIIVTSVDVEVGKWPTTSWQGKVDAKPSGNKPTTNGNKDQEANFVPTQRIADSKPIASGWDWETVDSSWGTYPLLTSRDLITKGNILLWKELALNTATYLPEIMVHAGEIEEVTNEEEVKLRLIPRFGDEEVEMEEQDEGDVVIRNITTLEDYRLFI